MKLTPLHEYLLVEVEESETTASGIILQKKPLPTGKVIAISKEIKDIKKGDRILFNKYSPLEVEVDGKKTSILDYSDVYGVII